MTCFDNRYVGLLSISLAQHKHIHVVSSPKMSQDATQPARPTQSIPTGTHYNLTAFLPGTRILINDDHIHPLASILGTCDAEKAQYFKEDLINDFLTKNFEPADTVYCMPVIESLFHALGFRIDVVAALAAFKDSSVGNTKESRFWHEHPPLTWDDYYDIETARGLGHVMHFRTVHDEFVKVKEVVNMGDEDVQRDEVFPAVKEVVVEVQEYDYNEDNDEEEY
jgi:hypothetical protein